MAVEFDSDEQKSTINEVRKVGRRGWCWLTHIPGDTVGWLVGGLAGC